MASEYVPVRLSTLRTGVNLPFDLYIKVSQRYLLYIRNGDDFDSERYRGMKKKKVRRMFIPPEHEDQYQSFIDAELDSAINATDMSASERASIVTGVAKAAILDLELEPDSIKAFQGTEKAVSAMLEVVNGNTDVLKEMMGIDDADEELVVQSAIKTAGLVLRYAKSQGLSQQNIVNLGVAAMVRDLGKAKIESKYHYLFNKDHSKFTDDEWKIYKEHPRLSVEIIRDKDYINDQIKEYVLNHEEKLQGSGFPQGLQQLSAEQEMLCLCNCFDYYHTCLGLSPSEAMKKITIDELGNFQLETINKFKGLLKKENIQ